VAGIKADCFLAHDTALAGTFRCLDRKRTPMAAPVAPNEDDVVVRQKRGNPSTVYLLGTPLAPDQFILRTRDEAVSQALAFAKRHQVRAWFANGDDEFLLLGTFRKEHAPPEKSS
jgi:hypothetical protein